MNVLLLYVVVITIKRRQNIKKKVFYLVQVCLMTFWNVSLFTQKNKKKLFIDDKFLKAAASQPTSNGWTDERNNCK